MQHYNHCYIYLQKFCKSFAYPHHIKTTRKCFDREPNDMTDAGKQPVMTVFFSDRRTG